MLALAFDYRNGMIAGTWYADCSFTESVIEKAVSVQGGGIIGKEVFDMIL